MKETAKPIIADYGMGPQNKRRISLLVIFAVLACLGGVVSGQSGSLYGSDSLQPCRYRLTRAVQGGDRKAQVLRSRHLVGLRRSACAYPGVPMGSGDPRGAGWLRCRLQPG